jgi:hypothetical protein
MSRHLFFALVFSAGLSQIGSVEQETTMRNQANSVTFPTQAELDASALEVSAPFQRERLEMLLKAGWKVTWWRTHRSTAVVCAYNGEQAQVVCPNGALAPVQVKGAFEWSWPKMAALREAPAAPGLVNAR